MERNNMWKHYSIIGLIISLIILFSSCADERYTRLAEYHFVNETNYAITYPVQYKVFNVAPKSITVFKQSSNGLRKVTEVSDYGSPFANLNDKLIINFNATRCLIDVKIDEVNSVKNINNYVAEKIGENHYRFTYTFTEADYNRAVACP